MVELLVFIIILGLVYWAVSLIPLPAPFPTIVQVIFIIIAVLALLNALGFTHYGLTGLPRIN